MDTPLRSPRRLLVAAFFLIVIVLTAVCPVASASALATAGAGRSGRTAPVVVAPRILGRWGVRGAGELQFYNPTGVAVRGDLVYVADAYNFRVQVLWRAGLFYSQWDGRSSGAGGFSLLSRLAVDRAGAVYVCDGQRVRVFSQTGTFIRAWGDTGAPADRLGEAYDIALDEAGAVYVADQRKHRVQKTTATGVPLGSWGSEGSGPDQFADLTGIALSPSGSVYTLDADNSRVTEYTSDGKVLNRWGGFGQEPGQFEGPVAIAVDADGFVYVSDNMNNRIQVFRADGSLFALWPVADVAGYILDLAIADGGEVFVADQARNEIRVYQPLRYALDTTPPTTTVTGVDGRWHNTDVELRWSAADEPGGSGLARTYVRVSEPGQLPPLPPRWTDWLEPAEDTYHVLADPAHVYDGETRYEFYSVDAAGNEESPVSATVRIDTTAPVTKVAPVTPSTVEKGAKVVVRMTVVEQLSEKVRFRLGFYDDAADKIVRTQTSGWLKTPRTRPTSYRFVCRLAPGAYHIVVEATDLAGNTGEPVSTPLRVR